MSPKEFAQHPNFQKAQENLEALGNQILACKTREGNADLMLEVEFEILRRLGKKEEYSVEWFEDGILKIFLEVLDRRNPQSPKTFYAD